MSTVIAQRRRVGWNAAGALAAVLFFSNASAAMDQPGGGCVRSCKVEAAMCVRDECASLRGTRRSECKRRCLEATGCGGARIRTLAYVVTECRNDGGRTIAKQSLRVRRRNCDPVTVVDIPFGPLVPDTILCRTFGASRFGFVSALAGAFQRLGVSPDGRHVVFEVTDQFSLSPGLIDVTEEQKGFFIVDADGANLRRLGAPSSVPPVRVSPFSLFSLYLQVPGVLRFSPGGDLVAYTDLGSADEGPPTVQVFVLDLRSGERTQVTHLPTPTFGPTRDPGLTTSPRFLDDRNLLFESSLNPTGADPAPALFKIRIGEDSVTSIAPVPPGEGNVVVPNFSVAGRDTAVLGITLEGEPVAEVQGFPRVVELFAFEEKNGALIQLTNFSRGDTVAQSLDVSNRRAFFVASADPFETNPTNNCQLFSIDTAGRRLRQLTFFADGEFASSAGCGFQFDPFGSSDCSIFDVSQDPVTGTLVFYSTCGSPEDSLGSAGLFAIRPDGSGLRQLVRARGMASDGIGFVVELIGPFAHASRR